MDSEEQGYNDFWHYDHPRQPSNALYMKGWTDGFAAYVEGNFDDDEEESIIDY